MLPVHFNGWPDWCNECYLTNVAAYCCNAEALCILHNQGDRLSLPTQLGYNALHYALSNPLVSQGRLRETCRVLLDAETSLHTVNQYMGTPLHIAAERQEPAICQLLLERGAAINAVHEHGTDNYVVTRYVPLQPLHYAVRARNTAVCVFLLREGADVHGGVNQTGLSPLMEAAHAGHSVLLKLLLGYGARVDQEYHGDTAFSCALKKGIWLAYNMLEFVVKQTVEYAQQHDRRFHERVQQLGTLIKKYHEARNWLKNYGSRHNYIFWSFSDSAVVDEKNMVEELRGFLYGLQKPPIFTLYDFRHYEQTGVLRKRSKITGL